MAKSIEKKRLIKKATRILREEGIREFFKRALSYLSLYKLNTCILPYAWLKIKYLNKKGLNLDDWVNISFYNFFGLIRPMQIQGEILELVSILNEIKPKIVIEIGTAGGGTLFLFCRVASGDATIISIDLPGGKFGGCYSKWKIPLYKAFKFPKQKLHLIRADSHNQETLEKVRVICKMKVDFLFIDGDHSYEGVKMDFEMYSPFVKEGGIIAFHDIVSGPKENVGGVPEFWREIKSNYSYQEIIRDRTQGGWGLGMLKIGRKS